MNLSSGNLIIFGCGGHSRSVADVVLLRSPRTSLIFVDDHANDNEQLYGFPVVREVTVDDLPFFLAIGDNAKRKAKLAETGEENLVSVVSASAHLGHQSILGSGVFIGNFCHIGPEAKIGKNTIINTASVVEHEVTIGSHCHIGPNAAISGRCTVGDLVLVGVGATVKDFVRVCSNVIIGAGATVVKDINESGTYVGTPAHRIK